MPIQYYGPGNWSTGSFKLPEMGITETLFPGTSQKSSLSNAEKNLASQQQGGNIPSLNLTMSGTPATPSNSQVLGVSDTKSGSPYDFTNTSFTSPSGSSKSSSGGSSGGSSSNNDDAIMREINSAYDDALGYISNARNRLSASYPDFMKIATSPYEAIKPQIQQAAEEGTGKLQGFIQDTYKQGQSAYDDARRLYNELNQRNLSQFGSGALSSAGQAASELLGREQFKQFGNIGSSISDTVQGLNKEIFNLGERTKAQIQSIDMQMQQAKAQAELQFRDRMAALDDEERKTRKNKSIDKLNELKSLRDYVRQAQQWADQLKAGIQNEASIAAQGLYSNYSQFNNGVTAGVDQGQRAFNQANDLYNGVGDQMAYNNSMGLGGVNYNPWADISGNYNPDETQYP